MSAPDSDPTELQLFGLPGLLLGAVVVLALVYTVARFVTAAWPMARWMAFAPPG